VIGAPVFGALVDLTGGYAPGWLLVGALFAAAAALALGWRRRRLSESRLPGRRGKEGGARDGHGDAGQSGP
jgi:hypothetical protein